MDNCSTSQIAKGFGLRAVCRATFPICAYDLRIAIKILRLQLSYGHAIALAYAQFCSSTAEGN